MKCNSSKFLLIAILTFTVGMAVVKNSDNLINPPVVPKSSAISPQVESRPDEKDVVATVERIQEATRKAFGNYKERSCENLEGWERLESGRAKHTINGGLLNGKIFCPSKPIYPQTALNNKIFGDVQVQVLVNEDGEIIQAKAISGHPLLRKSAVEAAYKTKFSPTLLSGEIVRVKGILVVNFVLPSQ